jgi:hypothetical protein
MKETIGTGYTGRMELAGTAICLGREKKATDGAHDHPTREIEGRGRRTETGEGTMIATGHATVARIEMNNGSTVAGGKTMMTRGEVDRVDGAPMADPRDPENKKMS